MSVTAAGATTVDLGYERFRRSDLPAARDAMASHTVKNLHLAAHPSRHLERALEALGVVAGGARWS